MLFSVVLWCVCLTLQKRKRKEGSWKGFWWQCKASRHRVCQLITSKGGRQVLHVTAFWEPVEGNFPSRKRRIIFGVPSSRVCFSYHHLQEPLWLLGNHTLWLSFVYFLRLLINWCVFCQLKFIDTLPCLTGTESYSTRISWGEKCSTHYQRAKTPCWPRCVPWLINAIRVKC